MNMQVVLIVVISYMMVILPGCNRRLESRTYEVETAYPKPVSDYKQTEWYKKLKSNFDPQITEFDSVASQFKKGAHAGTYHYYINDLGQKIEINNPLVAANTGFQIYSKIYKEALYTTSTKFQVRGEQVRMVMLTYANDDVSNIVDYHSIDYPLNKDIEKTKTLLMASTHKMNLIRAEMYKEEYAHAKKSAAHYERIREKEKAEIYNQFLKNKEAIQHKIVACIFLGIAAAVVAIIMILAYTIGFIDKSSPRKEVLFVVLFLSVIGIAMISLKFIDHLEGRKVESHTNLSTLNLEVDKDPNFIRIKEQLKLINSLKNDVKPRPKPQPQPQPQPQPHQNPTHNQAQPPTHHNQSSRAVNGASRGQSQMEQYYRRKNAERRTELFFENLDAAARLIDLFD